MPSVSPQQRRFFFATKGPAWTKKHHFDQLAVGAAAKKKLKKKGA